jgi:acetolactate synthase-1/3 small subunit
MFIKVLATAKTRSQIIEIAQIFRSKIVDISNTSITLEVTGDPGKTITIQQLLSSYKVLEIVRTGKLRLNANLELIQSI